MQHPKLRISSGTATDDSNHATAEIADHASPLVTVTLGEILPALAEAVASRRSWVRDFEDSEISIPSDLYEVVLAYQFFRCAAA